MATSPNYGWSEPDNSSLVKNGAADIRTLGDAIDTSVWNVGYGQAGKNKIINGDFGIWQRGTSITIGVGAFWADRYSMQMTAAVPTGTASRQAFTPGAAPVAGYEGNYFGRINVTAHNNSTLLYINQKIEDVTTFAGQTITLSAFIKGDAATNIGANMVQNFGSGGSGAVVTSISPSTNITSGWVRYSWTVAVPSISGKTIGTGSSLEFRFNIPTSGGFVRVGTYDFWAVQVEAGSKATPFQTATGTIQGELAACKRYLPSVSPADAIGYAYGTNTTLYYLPFDVEARTAPTGITLIGTYQAYALNVGSTITPAFNLGKVSGASVTGGLTITAGQGSRLQAQGTATILFTGCEL